MTTLKKIFSDIDLTFNRQPGKGDIALRYDEQAIISSVRNLLQTNFYERPFQPNLGCNITSLLFEPISPITATAIQKEIQNTLENFEPRVKISDIDVTAVPDEGSFFVRLEFFIGNNTSATSINLLLHRNR